MHALFLVFVELCNLKMSVYMCFHIDSMIGCCDETYTYVLLVENNFTPQILQKPERRRYSKINALY